MFFQCQMVIPVSYTHLPNKKATYDRFGHAAFEQGAGNGGAGGFGGFGFEDVDLGDIFGSFFGGGGRSRQRNNGPRRGDDHLMGLRCV